MWRGEHRPGHTDLRLGGGYAAGDVSSVTVSFVADADHNYVATTEEERTAGFSKFTQPERGDSATLRRNPAVTESYIGL